MARGTYEVKEIGYGIGTYLQIERGEDERWSIPETISAKVVVEGYRCELTTGIDDSGFPTIVRLVVERNPDGPPMSDLVRGPWAKILDEVVRRAAQRWERDPETGRWVSRIGGGRPAPPAWVTQRGRRSGQQREDIEREIEQVIELWDEAQKHSAPIEFLRDRLGLSRRTTQRRVEKAVERMNREGS